MQFLFGQYIGILKLKSLADNCIGAPIENCQALNFQNCQALNFQLLESAGPGHRKPEGVTHNLFGHPWARG